MAEKPERALSAHELAAEIESTLGHLAETPPAELPAMIAKVRTLREDFHNVLARHVEPVLNEYVKTLPQSTVEEKRDLAKSTNFLLRSVGLALREGKSGEDAYLRADVGHNPERGRFQLCLTASRGAVVKSTSGTALGTARFHLEVGPSRDRHLHGGQSESWSERTSGVVESQSRRTP